MGLATAPVLFAVEMLPELNEVVGSRFEMLRGHFSLSRNGGDLDETRLLAKKHCDSAIAALEHGTDNAAFVEMCDKVLNNYELGF